MAGDAPASFWRSVDEEHRILRRDEGSMSIERTKAEEIGDAAVRAYRRASGRELTEEIDAFEDKETFERMVRIGVYLALRMQTQLLHVRGVREGSAMRLNKRSLRQQQGG
jgi:hypothetical protein